MAATQPSLPVLIVGAGPVGLTLASELTRFGVAVRIVDKAAQRTDKSKALVIWSRTLELLDRGMGAARFVETGFKVGGIAFMTGDTPIGRVTMDGVESAYNFALMIPQADTERLLEEALDRQGVRVERGTEATALTIGHDGVEARLQHADGRTETVAAQWLAGCDGAHSLVRHTMGSSFSGETLPSDWMLADVHMDGYPQPEGDASIYWHRDGILIVFPMSRHRYRIIADLPPSGAEHPPTPTLDDVQALVGHRGSGAMTVRDPVWLSGFRINGRKVTAYRHGRAFLAGDAAHIHSPAGGQGMNTGMQDAINLAWKLALVVHGTCPDSLLDSYGAERSPVGEQVLKAADRMTAVGTLRNPLAQGLRNAVSSVLLGLPFATHAVVQMVTELAIHYPHSPLNGPSMGGAPHPGDRMPPVAGDTPAGSGPRPRFRLHAEHGSASEALVQKFGDLLDADLSAPVEAGAWWLVRPDGYVACSARTPEVIGTYLTGLRGGATPRAT